MAVPMPRALYTALLNIAHTATPSKLPPQYCTAEYKFPIPCGGSTPRLLLFRQESPPLRALPIRTIESGVSYVQRQDLCCRYLYSRQVRVLPLGCQRLAFSGKLTAGTPHAMRRSETRAYERFPVGAACCGQVPGVRCAGRLRGNRCLFGM